MGLLGKAILAAIVGAVAYLVCVFVGGLLASLGIPPAEFVGKFLKEFAWAIAVLVALWYFFAGGTWTWPGRTP